MEKITNKRTKKCDGYKLWDGQITIHSHIDDPENWYISCSYLDIYRLLLCPQNLTEQEVEKAVESVLVGLFNEMKFRYLHVFNMLKISP